VRVGSRPGRGGAAAAVGLAVLLSGCSSYDALIGSKPSPAGATGSSSSSFSDRFNNLLLGTPSTNVAEGGGAPPPELDCPTVEIRQGASTFAQSAQESGSNALLPGLQGRFGKNPREGRVAGAQ